MQMKSFFHAISMNHLPFILVAALLRQNSNWKKATTTAKKDPAPRYGVLKKGNGTKCAPFINVVVLKASFFYEDSPLYLQS